MIKALAMASGAMSAALACAAWVSAPAVASVDDAEVAGLYGGEVCFTRVVVHCGLNSDIEGCNWFVGYSIWAPTDGPGWKFPTHWLACSWSGSWECGMIPWFLEKCTSPDGDATDG